MLWLHATLVATNDYILYIPVYRAVNVLLDALAVLEAQREAELRLAVPAREMRQGE